MSEKFGIQTPLNTGYRISNEIEEIIQLNEPGWQDKITPRVPKSPRAPKLIFLNQKILKLFKIITIFVWQN